MASMEVRPILSALLRNKVAALSIAAQIALTLAVLSNALFIIEQRVSASRRPTGVDEANVFFISNQWVGSDNLDARVDADLAAIRQAPGVIDAFVSNSYPLANGGWDDGVRLAPDQPEVAHTALYFADEHAIAALGLALIASRNFEPAEVQPFRNNDVRVPSSIIVTKALADRLFPRGDALGQSVYMPSFPGKVPIVGVLARLQVPWVAGGVNRFEGNSTLLPFRQVNAYGHYLVRARPGRISEVMHEVEATLNKLDRRRVIEKIWPLTVQRAYAYRDDRGLAVVLSVVCSALLAVTGFGIIGITSHWVSQRRRHIGIRRALGATRANILRYFQIENLLISVAGVIAGIGLALAGNLWMVRHYAMVRLGPEYTLTGALLLLLLGQLAALWPALRAAAISPADATRAL
jgi:putative ABC transport system permease protein